MPLRRAAPFCARDWMKRKGKEGSMITFLLWCIVFILCWPIAIAALLLYPLVWLLLLPFRLVGFAVGAVMQLVWGIVTLPFRILRLMRA